MAVNAYFQPKFLLSHLGAKAVNMSTDTFKVGLWASGSMPARGTSEGYEFVSDFTGGGLTEVVAGSYSRLSLTSVTWTASALVVTFTAANPTWTTATFTTIGAWIHDETNSSGTDATRPVLCYFDFGGSFSPAGVNFILSVNASGLVTGTAAQ